MAPSPVDPNKGLGDWYGSGPLALFGASPQLRYSFLLMLNHHTWVLDQSISHICLSYS